MLIIILTMLALTAMCAVCRTQMSDGTTYYPVAETAVCGLATVTCFYAYLGSI
jgi:hypothetical protein